MYTYPVYKPEISEKIAKKPTMQNKAIAKPVLGVSTYFKQYIIIK